MGNPHPVGHNRQGTGIVTSLTHCPILRKPAHHLLPRPTWQSQLIERSRDSTLDLRNSFG